MRTCSHGDCTKKHKGHGYCQMHLARSNSGRSMDGYERLSQRAAICAVPDCDNSVMSRDMCRKHYARWSKGQPLNRPQCGFGVRPRPLRTSTACHRRVYVLWGSAKNYTCIGCGSKAAEWAYDGTDPDELYLPVKGTPNASWTKSSQWPEFYKPLCLRCHRTEDKGKLRAEMYEYREWKWRTKRTVNDLPARYQQRWDDE